MFIMANLLIALAQVLDYTLWAYWWILLGRVVISWVNADPDNPIVRFLYVATEPVLARVRRMLPVYAGGFDLSPIVVRSEERRVGKGWQSGFEVKQEKRYGV